MKKVIITGASGFIGRALSLFFGKKRMLGICSSKKFKGNY